MRNTILFTCGYLTGLAFVIWVTYIIWKGTWTNAVEAARLDALAHSELAMIVVSTLFGAGLLIGHIRKIAINAGPANIQLDGDDDADKP